MGVIAKVETNQQSVQWGAMLSGLLHLCVLGFCFWYFRQPLTTQIVAAGAGENGGTAIEVGVVDAAQLSQFGLTKPKAVSFAGTENTPANNVEVETAKPKVAPDAEVLPSTTKAPKPVKEKVEKTERPTASQNEQPVTKQPLRGSSANTNVEVGRSAGIPTPALTNGVGVATANVGAGASGVPGGSEYGRRIQMILSRNYNPPGGYDTAGQHFVVIQLRIARDGRILSLAGGRVAGSYIKRRSPIEQVNFAAERAIIASNPLPPFPNGFLLSAEEAVAEIWFRYPK
ncbi:MAG: TonB C-terminal domain-containing protein [Acidobacteria bacterium]|nr:TonB C-terminal domain-containing protein [Acidobacteriota bacterium]MBI3426782.1 TonB C-terminal domain-containing protein [Acidobacteriota bacterium]